MTKEVRTRFAPSPTGDLHVGGARTALFNWLFTRNQGGDYILRIEDTDFNRSADQYTEQIKSALDWLGLNWDEGPDVGGPHEPYHQSQRLDRYKEVADELMKRGVVYPCYCTAEELEAERERQRARREPPRYSGRCRNLSEAEKEKFEAEGRDYAYRYRIPEKPATVKDIAKGEVSFPPDQVGDFIVIKSNGSPAYNFAVVVDDHDMGITHVVRGDDHLSNTPRQIYLYEEMGWQPPKWCHLAMILGSDGERLSKRHGATDVEEYREKGFLPEAMVNALALLGWSPPDGVEVKDVDELIEAFSLERVNKSASRFDFDKVRYLNGQHLRALPATEICERLEDFLPESLTKNDRENLPEIVELLREQLELLTDFAPLYETYFVDFSPEPSAVKWLAEQDGALEVVTVLKKHVEAAQSFSLADVESLIKAAGDELEQSGADLYKPMRVAVTGQLEGPEFHRLMVPLGRQRCLDRIETVLQAVEDLN